MQKVPSNNSLPYTHSTGVISGSLTTIQTHTTLTAARYNDPLFDVWGRVCLSVHPSVCLSPPVQVLLVEPWGSVSPWYMNYITKVDRELLQTWRMRTYCTRLVKAKHSGQTQRGPNCLWRFFCRAIFLKLHNLSLPYMSVKCEEKNQTPQLLMLCNITSQKCGFRAVLLSLTFDQILPTYWSLITYV